MSRSAALACVLLVLGVSAAACGPGAPPDTVHRIVPHDTFGCPVASVDQATVELTALGDFGDSANTTEVFTGAAVSGRSVGFPAALAGAQATVRGALGTWTGVGLADATGDVDFTLWPVGEQCDVADWGVLSNAQGQAFTTFAGGGRVLVAGGEVHNGPPPYPSLADATVFDVRTGMVVPVMNGMHAQRAWAGATPFGDDAALVTGGADRDRVRTDAEILSGDEFDRMRLITLGTPRAHHAAIVDNTGRTLLIGGVDDQGALVPGLEAVDPKTFANNVQGLGQLALGRVDPVAIRLANGVIVVGGGMDGVGEGPQPRPGLEWFAANGSTSMDGACPDSAHDSGSLPGNAGRTMVALAGGDALVVDPSSCCDSTCTGQLWWITPDHCAYGFAANGPICNPRLVAAADGMPWLWDGRAWRRVDPWALFSAQTGSVPREPLQVPDSSPTDTLDAALAAPLAIDPGLFVWLARDPVLGIKLRGFRHDTRNEYTRDGELLVDGTEHVTPVGNPPPSTNGPSFDGNGLLLVGTTAVVVTDTTYADVSIEGTLGGNVNPDGAAPPLVQLGDPAGGPATAFEIGGTDCPWLGPAGPGSQFTVVRAGSQVTATVGGMSGTCSGPVGRVTVGLRAPRSAASTVVRAFKVKRLP